MFKNYKLMVLSLLLIATIGLAACQKVSTAVSTPIQLPTQQPTQPTIQKPTQQPTQTSLPASTRKGAWVDSLIFSEQDVASAAIAQIKAGDIDIYASPISDPAVFKTIKSDPKLSYVQSVGSYFELTLNPAGPEFTDGSLNPFNDPKIREAMNWLIDRNHIVQEIFGGLAAPRYVPTSSYFPDYTRYIDIIRTIEVKYAYDKDKAKQVVAEEMDKLGATLGSDGKWLYKDQPVVLIALIRTEDKRMQIGDYVSDQLESIGLTVDRQYKDRSGAGAILGESAPDEGQWGFYTGGWITNSISRDDSTNFAFFYGLLPDTGPMAKAHIPSPDFVAVAQKLWVSDYTTLEQRADLWAEALRLAMEDSARVWLVDLLGITPMRADMTVAYDLSGAVTGSQLYPYTIRFKGQEGGTIRIAQPGILVAPWNTVAGSGWAMDAMPQNATRDYGTMTDPYTGLFMPLRIEKADVVVKEGLPVAKSLDWLTLSTAPNIEVPKDAWVDWDAKNQTFITAGEKYTQTLEANAKITVYYPPDLFTTIKWHDGSPISPGDFIMSLILRLDPGKADSPIYDESIQSNTTDAFLSHFKGLKILSTQPFVYEFYDDQYSLDAETMVWSSDCFPLAPWQTLALGYLADSSSDKNTELAFSEDKAGVKEVEWLSFVSGPSMEILNGWMTKAAGENFIPYAPALNQFITSDEARLRWSNLQGWYKAHGHFWVGNGPFYLDKVYPVEKILTLQRFQDYPDLATRWEGFGAPMLATVAVDGPNLVKAGDEPVYDVFDTYEDQPYPQAQIDAVKYLLFDASNALINSGAATVVKEGHYTITLNQDLTSSLKAGSYKLEVVFISKAVSIPVITDFEFVVQGP